MDTVIIVNPRAAAGRVGRRWSTFEGTITSCLGAAKTRFTRGAGDATEMTREALAQGAERIVVVGGDGTINEVVNGFFDNNGLAIAPDALLAVFPGGTGGDFARSIGMSGGDPERGLTQAEVRRIDLGKATFVGHDGREMTRHFINISSFGSSGLIVDKVNKTPKFLGGKASFYLGTVRGLLEYRNQPVRIRVEGQLDEEMVVNTVAVANGRFFGGSMMIAPEAMLDDGQLDVTIIGDLSTRACLRHGSAVYKGEHMTLPGFHGARGKAVTAEPVESTPILIDIDGEQPGKLPVRYEIIPKAINLLAPWHRAVAVTR